jgi:hypothetical protein
MSQITEFGKTVFSGGQDNNNSLKQTFAVEAIQEDTSNIDRQSKEEPPQRLKPTYNLNQTHTFLKSTRMSLQQKAN